ncbi:MAG: hypothetical protein KAQ75_07670 [Bacteroidales bacterium]|nr:hypothetical protein [Bacteroidales bacterium]
MKVRWTPTSKVTYLDVLSYLNENWTKKELQNFVDTVEKVISQIVVEPYMFAASKKKKNIRKGFVTKHNTLYYRIKPRKKEIELLTFWDNRQDPGKLPY